MRRIKIWMLLVCITHVAKAQVVFTKELFVQGNDTLRYRLLAPANYDPAHTYPLLVYLHGSGQRGSDNEALLSKLAPIFTSDSFRNAYPCYLLVPQCPRGDAWVNFPDFPQSLHATDTATRAGRLVLALVEEMRSKANIDKRRVYLTGYSMGGEGTLDLLARKPEMFAAAIALCPVADTANAPILKRKPIWIFHGDKDAVNDVKYARMMVAALKTVSSPIIYTEYAGEGHQLDNRAYNEPGLFKWLFKQKLK